LAAVNSLKTEVNSVEVGGRGFTESKYIFIDFGGRRWANGDWRELEVLLKALRVSCDLCGKRLTAEDVGYVRVNGVVELALCKECLRDYLEWRGAIPP